MATENRLSKNEYYLLIISFFGIIIIFIIASYHFNDWWEGFNSYCGIISVWLGFFSLILASK